MSIRQFEEIPHCLGSPEAEAAFTRRLLNEARTEAIDAFLNQGQIPDPENVEVYRRHGAQLHYAIGTLHKGHCPDNVALFHFTEQLEATLTEIAQQVTCELARLPPLEPEQAAHA